jgi:processive 1,2-diacylglycerol beta-glucosyltransferase
MNTPKKILFVSCSAGAGHKRAAEALRLTCLKKHPETTATHIDLIDYSDWLIKKSVGSGYHFLARHLPEVYGLLYEGSDSTSSAKFLNYFSSVLKINTRKLRQFVEDFGPDRIVCTHFLAAPFLKSFAEKVPIDMIITDYELNRVVLDPRVRYFFAPNEYISRQISRDGRQSFPTGIPLHPEFSKQKDNTQVRLDLGLVPGSPVILVMAGGTGIIDSSRIVEEILAGISGINLIAISGNKNRPLFTKLNRIPANSHNKYIVIEFSEKIDELMRVADIIVTKPGGLTITECLHLGKPILMVQPVPGQEEANVRFVESNNFGQLITDAKKIAGAINEILRQPDKFSKAVLPLDAAGQIIDIVWQTENSPA